MKLVILSHTHDPANDIRVPSNSTFSNGQEGESDFKHQERKKGAIKDRDRNMKSVQWK